MRLPLFYNHSVIRIGSIVFRVSNLELMADFWCAALDLIPREDGSGDFRLLRPRTGPGPNISLDAHYSERTLPPRIHLDLYADDQIQEVERLITLGARKIDWENQPVISDYVILEDPEGNRFCVIQT